MHSASADHVTHALEWPSRCVTDPIRRQHARSASCAASSTCRGLPVVRAKLVELSGVLRARTPAHDCYGGDVRRQDRGALRLDHLRNRQKRALAPDDPRQARRAPGVEGPQRGPRLGGPQRSLPLLEGARAGRDPATAKPQINPLPKKAPFAQVAHGWHWVPHGAGRGSISHMDWSQFDTADHDHQMVAGHTTGVK